MADDAPSLFDVALFLVCCSRMVLDETLPYASMRLLDGAGRLLQAAGEVTPGDDFFAGILGDVEATKVKVMHDLAGYTSALDALQERFVREAKVRNAGAS